MIITGSKPSRPSTPNPRPRPDLADLAAVGVVLAGVS